MEQADLRGRAVDHSGPDAAWPVIGDELTGSVLRKSASEKTLTFFEKGKI